LLLSVDRITGLYLAMAFIERPDFADGSVGPFYGLLTWDYDNSDFVTLRMEDMVRHPAVALRKALASVGIDNPHSATRPRFFFQEVPRCRCDSAKRRRFPHQSVRLRTYCGVAD
jgi:hypothetical protein